MSRRYIVRLDDACPTMDRKKWGIIESILDKYNIKPIVAVIPNNQDPKQQVDEFDEKFWTRVRSWQSNGWYIALHGFNHVYESKERGLLPMNKQSEFAGINKNIQMDKIRKGIQIFTNNNINPVIWIAPSHTFDSNTLKVLKEETNIQIISDGIAYYPYNENDFFWIPQQNWRLQKKRKGIWTTCYHPNSMAEKDFLFLESFLKEHQGKFINDLNWLYKCYNNRHRTFYDLLYFYYFFSKRRLLQTKLFHSIYKLLKRTI